MWVEVSLTTNLVERDVFVTLMTQLAEIYCLATAILSSGSVSDIKQDAVTPSRTTHFMYKSFFHFHRTQIQNPRTTWGSLHERELKRVT